MKAWRAWEASIICVLAACCSPQPLDGVALLSSDPRGPVVTVIIQGNVGKLITDRGKQLYVAVGACSADEKSWALSSVLDPPDFDQRGATRFHSQPFERLDAMPASACASLQTVSMSPFDTQYRTGKMPLALKGARTIGPGAPSGAL